MLSVPCDFLTSTIGPTQRQRVGGAIHAGQHRGDTPLLFEMYQRFSSNSASGTRILRTLVPPLIAGMVVLLLFQLGVTDRTQAALWAARHGIGPG